jgi:hypothetical protein
MAMAAYDSPPLDFVVLKRKLADFLLPKNRTAAILLLCRQKPKSLSQQIRQVREVVFKLEPKKASCRSFEELFDMKRTSLSLVFRGIGKESEEPAPPHTKFSSEKEQEFVDEICKRYSDGSPFTPTLFCDWVMETEHVYVTRGYVTSFITRRSSQIQSGVASPLEVKRWTISKDCVDSYSEDLENIVSNTPACLLFNADESGVDEYVDSSPQVVLAPASIAAHQLAFPVQRKSNHSTIMPCISAAGDSLTPLLVLRRKTLDHDIFSHGLRKDEDMCICHSEKGYITKALFLFWLERIFIPAVQRLRISNGFEKEKSVLLMDGFSGHTGDDVISLLDANFISPVYFPPHSTHRLQPLDLTSFSTLKKLLHHPLKEDDATEQAHLVHKIIYACQDATSKHKNISAFERAGFELYLDKTAYRVKTKKAQLQKQFDDLLRIPHAEEQRQLPQDGAEK